ncbi:DNA ligase [Vibrio rotiferianus]|uniref:DNA ligase n=1 Tax=Vibrio rotiferianus TaxID=190895 RepID=UPI003909A558
MRMNLIALAVIATISATAESSETPLVPLAETYHQDIDIAEYWYSEKLDGIRAYWTGRQFVTRNGNTIHAPEWFKKDLPPFPLDGELWAGRGNFNVVQQTVLDKTPNDASWRAIDFMVFDIPEAAGDYQKRYYNLQSIVLQLDADHVKYIEHRPIKSEKQLFKQLDNIAHSKGEGVMLRKISSRYQAGRGSDLLKLKRYEDAEGVVIGYKPGTGRLLGMMGAILIQTSEGKQFYIGSGFTDEDRKSPPKLGATITYRFNGYTHNGIPKFARYLRERLKE